MQYKTTVSPFEKIISVISYYTMGIIGFIWIIISGIRKKKLRFFLRYNIVQSMMLSVFLAIINIFIKIFIKILIVIPFLTEFGIRANMFIQKRVLLFGLSFNKIEIIIFILLIYITAGIVIGRIFYIPVLTKIMKLTMR